MNEVQISLSPEAQDVLQRLSDHVGLGQAMGRALDEQNELIVADIKERISGPGVRRSTSKKVRQLRRQAQNQKLSGQRRLRASLSAHRMSSVAESGHQTGEYPGVDTGALRRSIGRSKAVVLAVGTGQSAAMEVHAAVGSGEKFGNQAVEYAAAQEFGSKTIPARPFVSRTVMDHLDDVAQAVSQAVVDFWAERSAG